MKAKHKFFTVRHGWIKEGQEVPSSAYQEAVAAGAIKYKTKVSRPDVSHKRHDTKQVEREPAESTSVQASDAEPDATASQTVHGKWFAS